MKPCSISFLIIDVDVADGILVIKNLVSNGAAKAINNSWAVIITKLIWKFGFHIFIMQNTVHPEKLKTFIFKIQGQYVLRTRFWLFRGLFLENFGKKCIDYQFKPAFGLISAQI